MGQEFLKKRIEHKPYSGLSLEQSYLCFLYCRKDKVPVSLAEHLSCEYCDGEGYNPEMGSEYIYCRYRELEN